MKRSALAQSLVNFGTMVYLHDLQVYRWRAALDGNRKAEQELADLDAVYLRIIERDVPAGEA